MIPRIMKSAIKVITVSEFSKTEITKYYDIEPNKIEVVYNAVSKDFKKVSSPNFRERKYLLAVSSLNYRKNFISVLKAFDIFEKINSETDLYIIGDLKNKNFKDIDIERYQSNPRIKFLGRVTDEELIYHYSIASGFIYPSLYEGFGIPPLEAQTCGCAVLAANIPPLREVLGESALYCNPYDVYDIANGMKIIIEQASNYRVLGSENSKRFSWKESAEKIAKTCEL
jgi:glycosyltransferase involved in cell wall biosynthesis